MATVPTYRSFSICSVGRQSLLSVVGLMYWILSVKADISTHHTETAHTSIKSSDGLMDISDICPGVEYLWNKTNVTIQQTNVSRCWRLYMPEFSVGIGVVYGICDQSTVYCRLHVQVPQGMFARVYVKRLAYWCESSPWKAEVYIEHSVRHTLSCDIHSLEEIVLESNANGVFFSYQNFPSIEIRMEAVATHSFIMGYTSAYSRYLILPEVRSRFDYPSFNISEELKTCIGWVIMASSQTKYEYYENHPCIELIYIQQDTDHKKHMRVCSEYDTPSRVFLTSHIHIYFRVLLGVYIKNTEQKLLFSFHSKNKQPRTLPTGLFNCSVANYLNFQHHLDCNLKTECNDGQDETEHCPFSSPDCQGLVASRNKCFQYVRLNRIMRQQNAIQTCFKIAGKPISIKTRKEQEDFLHIFKNKYRFFVIVGNSGWESVPLTYSMFRKWSDKTLIYNIAHFSLKTGYGPSKQLKTLWNMDMVLNSYMRPISIRELVCETQSQSESKIRVQTVELPYLHPSQSTLTQTLQNLIECSGSHVTHSFLSCDANSQCGMTTYLQYCLHFHMGAKNNGLVMPGKSPAYSFAMFVCDDDITVPYSLVCDFRHDCPDNSDESFCEHPVCNGFLCSNGQCTLNSQRCNGQSDCVDDSDETNCVVYASNKFVHSEADKMQQVFINLDGAGYFTQQAMKSDDSCPDTHYRCTEDWLYCLPVYTRCNGFSDCTYGEDEQDCEMVSCHGFYHCRSSKVCVHGNHLCDGWGQCPQRDDEWFCDTSCPEGCWCQGHSFLCPKVFYAEIFKQLRYLDAKESGMTLTDFSTNVYLIRLSLPHSSLLTIPSINLANLQFIDLTRNQIRNINMNVFFGLSNLKVLILANNPLFSFTSKPFNIYYALSKIDLSRTHLETFHNTLFMYLPRLKILNLSFSAITAIKSIDFQTVPQLTELDVKGNLITHFHSDALSGLSDLKNIVSSNFRLCCENIVMKQSSKMKCLSPLPVFSSCKNLLPTDVSRFFCWLVNIFAILGNGICFIITFAVKKLHEDNSILFLVHFQIANVIMGFQTSIVTMANRVFHGNYIYNENTWTKSVTCKTASFLSILSSEVSVLIIWFITLDQVIILCFPLTRRRFSRRSAAAACVVTLFVASVLAVVPFIPGLSHWGLDGQSGLCRLALFDCYNCNQQFRWFTVTVILNLLLCLGVVAGNVIIYNRIPKYQVVVDPIKRSVYSSADLTMKLAVTGSICWLSFGLTSVMTLCGVAVSDKVHMAMVVFMLPLNSAFSPLLYMWTVVIQQRQQAQEEKVLHMLKSKLSLPVKTST